ncbi:prolyl oligopeptidase family serine peptidase [Bradyrhizobium sp. DOA1]|uniref:prolyl oligopeptidase family serine peptidase n=1 Tax=Bradyrhizobium sp. DOA1 TaxID=1126616 RepID=UPI000A873DAC|nr:prolyl oligopeptidase family serine peptidase [Bradyrhizobium sp. DOA1]
MSEANSPLEQISHGKPTVSVPDDDPYLWLEEIEGAQALEFVEQQNGKTLEVFGGATFMQDRDELASIYDRADNIPYVSRHGDHLYNLWKDADNPRGLWRRTTLAEFRKSKPSWDVLLDVDRLAAIERKDWLVSWTAMLPGSSRVILALSLGGSDAVTLREFELTRKSFVPDGFMLDEAKGSAAWVDQDALLLSSAYGEGMATLSGYARTVRLWRRGDPIERASVVFETIADHIGVSCRIDRTGREKRVWFTKQLNFFNSHTWLGTEQGAHIKLDLPTDIRLEAHQDWLAVKLRSAATIEGVIYPTDTLLGTSLTAFLAGKRNFSVLFLANSPRRALQGFFWVDGKLVLSLLDGLRPVFEICTPFPTTWGREQLSMLPAMGLVNAWPLDRDPSESNGDLLAKIEDPLTPPLLMLLEQGVASPAVLKEAPKTFVADGLVVTQHEAISVDGERIPYVQTGPKQETGEAPVHMSGYGGFGISVKPSYNSALGKLWLERGGTTVQAHLRGGGEFGTRWHDAGRLAGKRLSHDDFASVAADLVRRGVTQAKRIAAEGGSNGGILISNMLTRYPEHFGALFCTIPLIDMRRYTKLLAGASWIAEFGDPDKPEEWEWLKTYSAYHIAKPGQDYPPILIATTRRDDRVHPGHARKMVAKLQGMGYEAYLYEPAAGGHGYGRDNKDHAGFQVLGFQFLKSKIGWLDGKA